MLHTTQDHPHAEIAEDVVAEDLALHVVEELQRLQQRPHQGMENARSAIGTMIPTTVGNWESMHPNVQKDGKAVLNSKTELATDILTPAIQRVDASKKRKQVLLMMTGNNPMQS
jgi:hypothetical protein